MLPDSLLGSVLDGAARDSLRVAGVRDSVGVVRCVSVARGDSALGDERGSGAVLAAPSERFGAPLRPAPADSAVLAMASVCGCPPFTLAYDVRSARAACTCCICTGVGAV